jgi:hypothetical protein
MPTLDARLGIPGARASESKCSLRAACTHESGQLSRASPSRVTPMSAFAWPEYGFLSGFV